MYLTTALNDNRAPSPTLYINYHLLCYCVILLAYKNVIIAHSHTYCFLMKFYIGKMPPLNVFDMTLVAHDYKRQFER